MPNDLPFYLLAAVTLGGALLAMTLRNLVHCALGTAAAFAGLAAIYLQLDAEFIGFAQFLVYVGAVAILVVFTVLLTRGTEIKSGVAKTASPWAAGLAVALLVFACIAGPILHSPSLQRLAAPGVRAPVKQVGIELMTRCVLPLETLGLLLTAALLGAAVIAMREPAGKREDQPAQRDVAPQEEMSAP